MGLRSFARKLKKNAGRVATGVATLGASELVGYDRVKDAFLGQDPDDVALPEGVDKAQQQRAELVDMIRSRMASRPENRNEATTAAQAAAKQAGQTAQERLQRGVTSQVAAARGLGVLGARRRAANTLALGSADIAGQVADANAQSAVSAAAQDVASSQRDEQQRLAELGLVADITTQEEQAALAAEEYRRANARKGLVNLVTAAGGTVIGTKLGGAEGGKIGGNFGYEVGDLFTR